MSARVDLHLHSKYSDRSAEWLLRRFDFPDSVSEPAALYAALKRQRMTLVTLTDHDTIDGCLEIADRPDTFLSVEISTQFPEDRCPVHVLAWGITESQYHEAAGLRSNIYELQSFLDSSGIVHAVAHPFYKLHPDFGLRHVEKLILLFKRFEGINGLRNSLLGDAARFALSRLTPQRIEHLANTHGLTPTHPEPWLKIFTGGSDDHGGVFPGSAWTECPGGRTSAEFLGHVRDGDCAPGGKGGSTLTISHGVYNTLYHFGRNKLSVKGGPTLNFVEKAFSRFMEGRDPTEFSLSEKIGFLVQGISTGKIFELANPRRVSLWKELADYLGQSDLKSSMARETAGVEEPERRAFLMANLLASQLAFRFFTRFVQELGRGNIFESVQSASALAPLVLSLSPYLYAFQSQGAPGEWLSGITRGICAELPEPLAHDRRAWFTDTLDDVNGVATTIRKMTAAGVGQNADITVVTCSSNSPARDIPIKNFKPIGEFELPEYELQKLSFPPILQILDYIQREGFRELIISTPGPLGLVALLAAKMFGLRTVAIYHTDFPQYVRILTDDTFLETLTWNFMHWFYNLADLTYVNSEHYRKCWIDRGIRPDRLQILPRGLDIRMFHPEKRDRRFWESRGLATHDVAALYVGRVSKEKNLDVLVEACRRLAKQGVPVRLLVVGDGPYLAEMKKALPSAIFTGYLGGEDLARAYASADFFAFPSTTDTFGNVILEAQASGLPCIVSDVGGPSELVTEGGTGLITRALDADRLARAMEKLAASPSLRETMSHAARKSVETRDWNNAFREFWRADNPPSQTVQAP